MVNIETMLMYVTRIVLIDVTFIIPSNKPMPSVPSLAPLATGQAVAPHCDLC